MDKEKQIENIASKLNGKVVGGFLQGTDCKRLGYITSKDIAEILVNANYGNIETARKETAKSYETRVIEVMHDYFRELESGEIKFDDVYELSVNAVKAITKDFE